MDIVTLLLTAKKLGFDVGTLAGLAVIAFILRRDVMKLIDKQVNKIVIAIGAHNDRLGALESDVKEIKKKIGTEN